MRFPLFALPLLLAIGCSSPAPPTSGEWGSVSDLPANVQEVAQKKLPAVKFDTARKINVRGEDRFEIRGKLPNGKIRELEITPAGEIREVE